MKIRLGELRQIIQEELQHSLNEKEEKDPDAKVRNRGDVVFPAGSSNVLDDQDHFPINNKKQAHAALAYANKYKKAPKWYKGSLKSLVHKVARDVSNKYSSIDVSDAAWKPGKG